MKKFFKFILIGLLFLLTNGCFTNERPIKVATIPLCNVQGLSYFTNDPRIFEETIPSEYTYYGTIDQFEEDHQYIDLSTNFKEYLNKEIYYHKSNKSYIYIKYDSNKFLKLYHQGVFEKLK